MFSSNTPSVLGLVIIIAGDIFVHRARERFDVHHAARVGLDVFDRVSGHVRGGGVGAVRGIGNQQLLARIALRLRAARESSGCR